MILLSSSVLPSSVESYKGPHENDPVESIFMIYKLSFFFFFFF